jgi:(p)ppGpp synthase/HD superfamily hydrolase
MNTKEKALAILVSSGGVGHTERPPEIKDFLEPGKKFLGTERFREVCRALHRDQRTKTDKPYFDHLEGVEQLAKEVFLETRDPETMASLAELHGDCGLYPCELIQQTALGHDLLEDQGDKIDRETLLAMKVHPKVVEAIEALTKKPREAYIDAISRAKESPLSKIVKKADNAHNSLLLRVSGLKEETAKTVARHTKYLLSHMFLSDRISRKEFVETLKSVEKSLKPEAGKNLQRGVA